MIAGKLSSKAQTPPPQAVRPALHLKVGDGIAYGIEDGRVVLTKAAPKSGDDPFATFSDWDSDAYRRACADLKNGSCRRRPLPQHGSLHPVSVSPRWSCTPKAWARPPSCPGW